MASTITTVGQVTVRGLDGTVAFSGMATTNNKLIARSFQKLTDENEAKDGKGAVFSKAYMNRRRKLTIDIIPFDAATNTLAAAKAKVLLLDNGAKVTIASSSIALFDGDWHLTGTPSIREANDGTSLVISMEIEQFTENGTAGYLGDPVTT